VISAFCFVFVFPAFPCASLRLCGEKENPAPQAFSVFLSLAAGDTIPSISLTSHTQDES
jgi:hypothetical protein